MTVAPKSANNIPQNGPGASPTNSTTFKPFSAIIPSHGAVKPRCELNFGTCSSLNRAFTFLLPINYAPDSASTTLADATLSCLRKLRGGSVEGASAAFAFSFVLTRESEKTREFAKKKKNFTEERSFDS